MNFDIPEEMQAYLEELDQFIEKEIKPLENSDDNIRFFDHRREDARTDWERGGLPNEEREQLLQKARTHLCSLEMDGHRVFRICVFYRNLGCLELCSTSLGDFIVRWHAIWV